MDALARVDPFAAIAGPAGGGAPPDPASFGDAEVARALASCASLGTACGLGV